MAIEKSVQVSEVTVTANGVVYFEEVTTVTEDGVELAKKHHRTILNPGQDLTGQPASVVAICNTAWTQEVIDAYAEQSAPSQPVGE